jgi:hypothetical protein
MPLRGFNMSITDVSAEDLAELPSSVGGAMPVQLPATRYRQGQRTQYHVAIPVWQVTQIITNKPDPARPLEGNRRVDPARAEKFATYILEHEGWVSPAIIVRAPAGELGFKPSKHFDNATSWGVLEVPLNILSEIILLDGQHRTLGIFRALESINKKVTVQREHVKNLEDQGQNPDLILEQRKRLNGFIYQRDRLSQEHISIDIAEVGTRDASQMFGDINNNAKGVNADLRTVLDQRDVVNRIVVSLMEEHPLLIGRVERGERARFSAANANLLGAKGVADIARAIFVGTGRIGNRVDDELNNDVVGSTERVSRFFDLLVGAFDELKEIIEGTSTPVELRQSSLLGSVTMLRALACTWFNLTNPVQPEGEKKFSRAQVEQYFRNLAPNLRRIPVTADDEMWMSTGAFAQDGTSTAPSARSQDFKALIAAMTDWARTGLPDQ